MHLPKAAEVEAVGVERAYMVTKAFTVSSPITMTFKQGKIIIDKTVIQRLLDGRAPIVEVEDMAALITCPDCKHVFTV